MRAGSVVTNSEFVQGVAAMSNAGIYGKARLCTGIFGTADCRLVSNITSAYERGKALSVAQF